MITDKPDAVFINVPYVWVTKYLHNHRHIIDYTMSDFKRDLKYYRIVHKRDPFLLQYDITQDTYHISDLLLDDSTEYICNSIQEFIEVVGEIKTKKLLGINQDEY
ncbi:hypothetical protein ACFBZI_10685 [Moraxella sp. ZJ142]|uniref:hypothetical protein n=1 Tax=Moraxella marmotae TaxID=3344520 RepID=UPI0035D4AC66